MGAPLRLWLVADDAVARAGLRAIAETAGLSVVRELSADDVTSDVADDTDAVVWDLGPAGSPEALRAIAMQAVVVAVLWSDEQARAALAAGARAVLGRERLEERLAPAVQAAVAGLVALDPALMDEVAPARAAATGALVEALTPREMEVLQLLAAGLTNRRIGERLGISEHTAKFHVNAILGKLAAGSRGEAIANAARLGLLML